MKSDSSSRKGIMNHLKHDMAVTGNFSPGFHLNANRILTTEPPPIDFAAFLKIVRENSCQEKGYNRRLQWSQKSVEASWKITEEEELKHIWDRHLHSRSFSSESSLAKLESSAAFRAVAFAQKVIFDSSIGPFIDALTEARARDHAVVVAIEQGLLRSRLQSNDGTNIRPPQFATKLWLCATGCRGIGKACIIPWMKQERIRPAIAVSYVERFQTLGKGVIEANRFREFVWERAQAIPRAKYRSSNIIQRRGYNAANPSYWVMGFDTLLSMSMTVPRDVFIQFASRVGQKRAKVKAESDSC